MKKRMAVLLVVAILTSVCCMGSVSASNQTTGSFHTNWWINAPQRGGTPVTENVDATYVLDSTVAYEGDQSMKVTYQNTTDTKVYSEIFQSAGHRPAGGNGTYTLSLYAKGTVDYVGFALKGNGGAETIVPLSDFDQTDTQKDGWKNYTHSFSATNAASNMRLCMITEPDATVKDQIVFYIDQIEMTGPNTDYFVDCFETDPQATPAPPSLPALGTDYDTVSIAGNFHTYWWNTNDSNGVASYSTNDGYYYDGSRSMHAVMNDATKSSQLTQNKAYRMKAAGTYDLTLYAKGKVDAISFAVFDGSDSSRHALNSDSFEKEAVTGADGTEWTKYTHSFTVNSVGTNGARLTMVFEGGTVDAYIDRLSLTCDATGYNFIDCFESNVGEVPQDPANPGEIPITVPDQTEAVFDSGKWTIGSTEATYNYRTTAMEAYSGKRSLHATVSSAGGVQMHISNSGTNRNFVSGTQYTITFYAKGDDIKNAELLLGGRIKVGNLTGESTAKADWTKYTWTQTYDGSTWPSYFIFVYDSASADFYVDDISIQSADGTTYTFFDGFENAGVAPAYEVTPSKIFNDQFEELTDVTAEMSGTTIIGSATVINNSQTEPFTAQVIVALYDGYELKQAVLSDVVTITTTDPAKQINCEMTLPTISDATGYKLKIFVWSSVESQQPLASKVEI